METNGQRYLHEETEVTDVRPDGICVEVVLVEPTIEVKIKRRFHFAILDGTGA